MPRRSSRTSASAAKTFIQRSRELSSEEKAIFHQVAGAGKSQVRREFFDLSDDDVSAIVERIDRGLQLAITRAS